MADEGRIKTQRVLVGLAERLAGCASLRPGSIGVVMLGEDGGDYQVECQAGSARIATAGTPRVHQFEILGRPDKVRALLSGEHDAVTLFLSGGIRLRGDLRYVSDLARELGIIEKSL
ncbi:hypothetical protein [Kocuria sp. NPDC057446]|uniref:hypothetical protein n=1 Tax=Kocuria sp. NPDC057446 TaxID=3346137 RepID=UPI0036995536